jgi:hypothetical protein
MKWLIMLLASTSAFAQEAEELAALKKKEPSVEQVQQAALKYFGVNTDRVNGMRAGAAWKAAVPSLEVSGGATGANIADTTVLDEYDPVRPWVLRSASGNALELRTTLAWDLPKFIYNPEELDVASLASVQRDIITKVTQLYFARRRLQLAQLSTKDPARKMAQELRVEELTAMISGMTGGWYAETLKK